jgi:hypothetical protein
VRSAAPGCPGRGRWSGLGGFTGVCRRDDQDRAFAPVPVARSTLGTSTPRRHQPVPPQPLGVSAPVAHVHVKRTRQITRIPAAARQARTLWRSPTRTPVLVMGGGFHWRASAWVGQQGSLVTEEQALPEQVAPQLSLVSQGASAASSDTVADHIGAGMVCQAIERPVSITDARPRPCTPPYTTDASDQSQQASFQRDHSPATRCPLPGGNLSVELPRECGLIERGSRNTARGDIDRPVAAFLLDSRA